MTNVPAATRTLAILQVLAKSGAPMPASSIAKRLSIPRSSTYHLLTAMQSEGFVIHFPEDERWGLGVAAFELGSAYLRHDPLERLARPILAKLVLATEQQLPAVAQLGILQGSEVLYLARELPRRPVTIVTEVGVRLPAALTASGRSMLSFFGTSQLRAIFATGWVNRTGFGPTNMKELTALLAAEKKAGFSFEEGFITDGFSSVSVAVTNHLGLPVASLAMTYRTPADDPADNPADNQADNPADELAGGADLTSAEQIRRNLVDSLMPAAKELSRRLGSH